MSSFPSPFQSKSSQRTLSNNFITSNSKGRKSPYIISSSRGIHSNDISFNSNNSSGMKSPSIKPSTPTRKRRRKSISSSDATSILNKSVDSNSLSTSNNKGQVNTFWLKCERIETGLILNVDLSLISNLSLSSLRQTMKDHAGSNSSSARIRYSEWIQLAQIQLQLPPNLAQVLFLTFETINNKNPQNQITATKHELLAIRKNKYVEFLNKRSVHMGSFFLYLYIQYLYHDRISSISPTQPMSNSNLKPRDHQVGFSKLHLNQEAWVTVIKDSMFDLLSLLSKSSPAISGKQLNRLSFLFSGGYTLAAEHEAPMMNMVPFWNTRKKSNVSDEISLDRLSRYLSERLTVNHILYPEYHENRRSPYVHQIIKLEKTTHVSISKSENYLSFFRLLACHASYVYLLSPFEYVEIFGCSNSTIVLGPVQKIVKISHCSNCRIIVPARSVHVNHSTSIKLYCCVNTPPVIYSNCRQIVIGPLNTYYSKMKEHLDHAGINPSLNQFSDPYFIPTSRIERPSQSVYRILQPEEFSQFVIPFEDATGPQHVNKVNPCVVPRDYGQAIQQKMVQVAKLFQFIRRHVKNDPEALESSEKMMQQQFVEWMKETNRWEEVMSLLNAQHQ